MIYTVTLNPALDRELLVPEIAFDTVLRATHWQTDFGGKGFNVSRLLSGFETPSTALGFIGGDVGNTMERGIQAIGINTDFVYIEGETRINVSIRSESDLHYVKVNEPGPRIHEEDIQKLLDKIGALATSGDWWVLAGNLPPGCPSDIYARIITIAQSHGAKTVLDTSGEALRLGCEASPFICKPNLNEAENLVGKRVLSPLELAAAVHSVGPLHVIISLGEDGGIYGSADDCFEATSPQIVEKNPIGAGDSMVGGIVWALEQGFDFREALRWGIACGAGTASLEGTSVATRKDAEALLDQVIIKKE